MWTKNYNTAVILEDLFESFKTFMAVTHLKTQMKPTSYSKCIVLESVNYAAHRVLAWTECCTENQTTSLKLVFGEKTTRQKKKEKPSGFGAYLSTHCFGPGRMWAR